MLLRKYFTQTWSCQYQDDPKEATRSPSSIHPVSNYHQGIVLITS